MLTNVLPSDEHHADQSNQSSAFLATPQTDYNSSAIAFYNRRKIHNVTYYISQALWKMEPAAVGLLRVPDLKL